MSYKSRGNFKDPSSVREHTVTLWVHDEKHGKYGAYDLVVAKSRFPHIKEGDIVQLWDPAWASGDDSDELASQEPARRLHVRVRKIEATPQGALELSLLAPIAAQFNLVQHRQVGVRVVAAAEVTVAFVQVVCRGGNLSRADMHLLSESMQGECVHVGQRLLRQRVAVQEILRADGSPVRSGVVEAASKFVFRSRSSRFCVLVQFSYEMWELDHRCELMLISAVHFLQQLLERWRAAEATHLLTLVAFSRVYQSSDGPDSAHASAAVGSAKAGSTAEEDVPVCRDSAGRVYQDYYDVLVQDVQATDVEEIVRAFKSLASAYPARVQVDMHHRIRNAGGSGRKRTLRWISQAHDGNVAEAMAVGLAHVTMSNCSAALRTTGQGVVLVTAGTGYFQVHPEVFLANKYRTLDHGVGMDVVCLGNPALHTVPLFCYRKPAESAGSEHIADFLGTSRSKSIYSVPHWLFLAYFNYRSAGAGEDFSPVQSLLFHSRLHVAPADQICGADRPVHHLSLIGGLPFASLANAALSDRDASLFSYPSTSSAANAKSSDAPSRIRQLLDLFPDLSETVQSSQVLLQPPPTAATTAPSPTFPTGSTSRHTTQPSMNDASVVADATGSYRTAYASPPVNAINAMTASGGGGGKRKGGGLEVDPFAGTLNRRDKSSWIAVSSNRRRWVHVYHMKHNVFVVVEHDRSRYELHWKSLVEPACLPLTTDYMPPMSEFMHFLESPYAVYSSPPYANSSELFRELVIQRLRQGFQIVQNSAVQDAFGSRRKVIFLSRANVYHKISQTDDTSVDINRLTDSRRRRALLAKRPAPRLVYGLRRPEWDRYVAHAVDLDVYRAHTYPWNQHDFTVADGQQRSDQLADLQWTSVSLLVVPIGSAQEEEERVSAFKKLWMSVERQCKKSLDVEILSKFGRTSKAAATPATLLDARNLDAVVEAVLNPATGPIICDRRHRLRMYPRCLVAEDLVDWVLKNVAAMSSRSQAVQLCAQLVAEGHIEHVAGRSVFKDGHFFYRVVKPSHRALPSRSASLSVLSSSPSPFAVHSSQNSGGSSHSLASSKERWTTGRLCVDIPLEPVYANHSQASEWVQWVCDDTYNPYEWFHIEIRSLGATGLALEQFVTSLERRAKTAQLPLVSAPPSLLRDPPNPLAAPLVLAMAPNATDSRTTSFSFLCEVLERNDFLPEKTAGVGAFVHRSGLVSAAVQNFGLRCQLNVGAAAYAPSRAAEIVRSLGEAVLRPLEDLEPEPDLSLSSSGSMAARTGLASLTTLPLQVAGEEEFSGVPTVNRLYYYLYLKGLPLSSFPTSHLNSIQLEYG